MLLSRMIKIVMVLTITSICGDNLSSKEASHRANFRSPANSTGPLILTADRDYFPSMWNNFNIKSKTKGEYLVPLEIIAKSGHSGKGWVTLQINSRKFCYIGNADSIDNKDGNKFLLQKEKKDNSLECHSIESDTHYIRQVVINIGDTIKLNVNGGGCKSDCTFTQAEAILALK